MRNLALTILLCLGGLSCSRPTLTNIQLFTLRNEIGYAGDSLGSYIESRQDYKIVTFNLALINVLDGSVIDRYSDTQRWHKPWTEGCFQGSVKASDRAGNIFTFDERNFATDFGAAHPCPPAPILQKLQTPRDTRVLTFLQTQGGYLLLSGFSNRTVSARITLEFDLCESRSIMNRCLTLRHRRNWKSHFKDAIQLPELSPGTFCIRNISFPPDPSTEYWDVQPENIVLAPDPQCFEISN